MLFINLLMYISVGTQWDTRFLLRLGWCSGQRFGWCSGQSFGWSSKQSFDRPSRGSGFVLKQDIVDNGGTSVESLPFVYIH